MDDKQEFKTKHMLKVDEPLWIKIKVYNTITSNNNLNKTILELLEKGLTVESRTDEEKNK